MIKKEFSEIKGITKLEENTSVRIIVSDDDVKIPKYIPDEVLASLRRDGITIIDSVGVKDYYLLTSKNLFKLEYVESGTIYFSLDIDWGEREEIYNKLEHILKSKYKEIPYGKPYFNQTELDSRGKLTDIGIINYVYGYLGYTKKDTFNNIKEYQIEKYREMVRATENNFIEFPVVFSLGVHDFDLGKTIRLRRSL